MNLIIVESPTKAKTIAKFIGNNYKVESSFGHIRDLPKNEMGIDIQNNFKPKYIIPRESKKIVSLLKKEFQKAQKVILATDEDREGEAIAWHLTEALGLDKEKTDRIVFHEITKGAILKALSSPRKIDMNLVNAQQARRILDRLVGYELSPFLWKKVARGLSAGRVQSVAVRLIVEREREIKNFESKEYWTIIATFVNQDNDIFKAKLNKIKGKAIDKFEIKTEKEANNILKQLKKAKYVISAIERKENKKNPPKPFITSTLQQTANRWLGFSAKQTMMIAQQLYEGVEIAGEGQVGLITYMRTDSFNLSNKFLKEAKDYLEKKFGKEYTFKEPRVFKTKTKGAQEAHEAIRPTEVWRDPELIKDSLSTQQYKLYKLIWQRALASQMPEAVYDSTIVDIEAKDTPYQFRSSGQVLKFDGFLKIYPENSQDIELPKLQEREELKLEKLDSEQHFTKPPARYSDAGLVKALERYGIGRPSTYAPTIATIIARGYVHRDKNKRLAPKDIAFVVNDLLVKHFPRIVDFQFTAQMEAELDNIAAGRIEWQPVVRDFYIPFHTNLENKYKEINKRDIMPEEKSEEICDKCGAPMIIKTGRWGKFLACSAFPKCRNIKSLNSKNNDSQDEKIKELQQKYANEKCDRCGSPMVIRNGRFGFFLACSAFPKCKNIKNIEENKQSSIGIKCPKCNEGEIVVKKSKKGIFYACNQYPKCKNAYWGKPTGEKCPQCGELMIETKNGAKCANKECGFIKE